MADSPYSAVVKIDGKNDIVTVSISDALGTYQTSGTVHIVAATLCRDLRKAQQVRARYDERIANLRAKMAEMEVSCA